ncbi:MAG TPA: MOSC domain-containing protein [Gemmatimonadaceae bacterium]
MLTIKETIVDSDSVGDPARFLSLSDLERELHELSLLPTDKGRVALIVRRVAGGRREVLDRVEVSADAGVTGDAWARRPQRDPDMQIAVMQTNVAKLIANGQPLTLFGDNLVLDLDLSTSNLPAGTRLRVGGALLEVTPFPHNGCKKFQARFGPDALRFVSMNALRHRNLRGIYMRVVEPGELRPGDSVEVLARARAAESQSA